MKILKAPPPRPAKAAAAPAKKAPRPGAMLQVRPDDPAAIAKTKRDFVAAAGDKAGSLYAIYESVVDALNREGEGRIRARYELGRYFNQAVALGEKPLAALATAIEKTTSFVREHRIVAERIGEDELGGLMAIRDGAGRGLDWMHIVVLATSLPDQKRRREFARLVAEQGLSHDKLALKIREDAGHLTSDPAHTGGRPFAVPKTLPALIFKAKQQTGSVARYLTEVLTPNLADLVKDTPPDKMTPEVAALMREFQGQLAGLREMIDSIEPQIRAQAEHVEAAASSDGLAVIDVEAVVVTPAPGKRLPKPEPAPAAAKPAPRPSRPAPPAVGVRAPGRRPKELDAPGVRVSKA